ncbi:hypothetical protein [Pectobacterium sp. B1J-3]|uniref:hypothetical protein n=1 Tax=Pectobacterium sp. B1J-3 TaxID=3385371 RepID=UPI0039066C51
MSGYNYQRMVEETLEEYERKYASKPEEQQVLKQRIAFMRRFSTFTDNVKTLVKNRCVVAGTDPNPVSALTESPRMDKYLDDVQEEIFMRAAMVERAMELASAHEPELHDTPD